MDKTERDRLEPLLKIVFVVCVTICYGVYEFTRQANFPAVISQCESSCEQYGRLDYVVYGKCQCINRYDNTISEKEDDMWAFPGRNR